jgi:hypothetical protein
MKSGSAAIAQAMQFETITAESRETIKGLRCVDNRLYAISGQPGVFRRAPRTGQGLRAPTTPGAVLAYFQRSVIELVRDDGIEAELREAGLVKPHERQPVREDRPAEGAQGGGGRLDPIRPIGEEITQRLNHHEPLPEPAVSLPAGKVPDLPGQSLLFPLEQVGVPVAADPVQPDPAPHPAAPKHPEPLPAVVQPVPGPTGPDRPFPPSPPTPPEPVPQESSDQVEPAVPDATAAEILAEARRTQAAAEVPLAGAAVASEAGEPASGRKRRKGAAS